ncbi:MAG: hypothetical protein QHJ81_11775 [Anaerolineae bacterium]|nr:hypothetical protein [Anaerolineae bacterium]
MDHVGILKRAFHITRRYRVLWIFGILLALFSSGGGSGPNINIPGGGQGRAPGGWPPGFRVPSVDPGVIVGIAIACCCLLLLFVVAGIIISYMARTALYRLVDEIEETGRCPSWREGFRLGWSQRALRIFGIDLAIGILFAIVVILLLALALSPLLLLMVDSDALRVLGIVLTIGLVLLTIGVLIVVAVAVSLIKHFIHRQAALEGRSIGESIVLGYQMVRANFKDAAIMWLLMLGVGFGWVIVMIPVFIIVLLLAAAAGGIPAWIIWQATETLWLTLLVGIPLFFLVMIPPLVFLNGLYLVFQSSVWTLTYREFRARA